MTQLAPYVRPGLGDAAQVASGVTSAAAAGATGAKVTTLLVAGSAASTVPVAGWVVGGVLAATAGTISLVKGIRQRKVSKRRALRWAKKLNLPDPESVPGFVLRLSKKPRSWRMRKLAVYKKRLRRVKQRQRKWRRRPGARRTLQVLTLGISRGPQRLRRYRTRLESRIALIEALNASYRRRARRRREQNRSDREQAAAEQAAANRAAEQARLDAQQIAGLSPGVAFALGATVLVGGVLVWQTARKKRTRP